MWFAHPVANLCIIFTNLYVAFAKRITEGGFYKQNYLALFHQGRFHIVALMGFYHVLLPKVALR